MGQAQCQKMSSSCKLRKIYSQKCNMLTEKKK